MPIQRAIDVAVPVKQAYNAWTRFEDGGGFFCGSGSARTGRQGTVSFGQAKMWGITKRFRGGDRRARGHDKADRVERHRGVRHTGVVTFHPFSRGSSGTISLGRPAVEPDRQGEPRMRPVKRAVRGDLHRFKAYVELELTKPRLAADDRGQRQSGSRRRSRPQSPAAAGMDPPFAGRSRRRDRGADEWPRRRAAIEEERQLEQLKRWLKRSKRALVERRSGSAAGKSRNPCRRTRPGRGRGATRTRPSETRSVVEREGHEGDATAIAHARSTRLLRW